ncbi:hypothetical protein OAD26_00500 [bacterium]|nr:hypothetical protein [bacterium]
MSTHGYTEEEIELILENNKSLVRALDDMEARFREEKERHAQTLNKLLTKSQELKRKDWTIELFKQFQPGALLPVYVDGEIYQTIVDGWLSSDSGPIIYLKSDLFKERMERKVFIELIRERKRKQRELEKKNKVVSIRSVNS